MAEKKIYGCIGRNLGHSYSVPIHNLLADYEYELIPLEPHELDGFFAKRDFEGINVTIPYKQDVMKYLDYIDPDAEQTGAVNTVVNQNGKLYGYNTDIYGLEKLIDRAGIEIKGKKVLILGTGGTSKTANTVCVNRGAGEIFKVSRGKKEGSITYGEAVKNHGDAQVIINCTPSGMFPANPGEYPLDIDAFPQLEGITDAVYNPLRTSFVLKGEKKNIKAGGGLYMLVMQAAKSACLFENRVFSFQKAEEVYLKILNSKRNIVLTGMPSSGKTTLGRLIAEKTGKRFIDTDELIVAAEGKSIPDIFALKGEEYFRDKESEIIRKLSAETGVVIATGGGAVLRESNINLLKSNGIICFLDRDFDGLTADLSRPLASDKDALARLYSERYGIYKETCDMMFSVTSVQETADRIIKELKI